MRKPSTCSRLLEECAFGVHDEAAFEDAHWATVYQWSYSGRVIGVFSTRATKAVVALGSDSALVPVRSVDSVDVVVGSPPAPAFSLTAGNNLTSSSCRERILLSPVAWMRVR